MAITGYSDNAFNLLKSNAMRGTQPLLQVGHIGGTSSRSTQWVSFDMSFWTALVHLRVKLLELEDLPLMYQQSLSPSVRSDDEEHRAVTCEENTYARYI